MNFVVFKNDRGKQFRLYVQDDNFEGEIVFKGHKLAVEVELLAYLIDFRQSHDRKSFWFLRYDKVISNVSELDDSMWIKSTVENYRSSILESWETILSVLEKRCGKFRKILITAVNI